MADFGGKGVNFSHLVQWVSGEITAWTDGITAVSEGGAFGAEFCAASRLMHVWLDALDRPPLLRHTKLFCGDALLDGTRSAGQIRYTPTPAQHLFAGSGHLNLTVKEPLSSSFPDEETPGKTRLRDINDEPAQNFSPRATSVPLGCAQSEGLSTSRSTPGQC